VAPVDFADTSRAAFDAAVSSDAADLCRRLAERISALFRAPNQSWQSTASTAIEALRSVGHDLWSFDDDGNGWQTWCGDYSQPVPSPAELILEFRVPDRVEVTWLRGNPKTIVASAIAGSSANADAG
jgi:hypothetical protein